MIIIIAIIIYLAEVDSFVQKFFIAITIFVISYCHRFDKRIRPMTEPPLLPLDSQLCFSIYSTGIAINRVYKPMLDELGMRRPDA